MNIFDKMTKLTEIRKTAQLIQDYREIRQMFNRMYDDIREGVDPSEFRYICRLDGKSQQYIEDEIASARKWIGDGKRNEIDLKT